jgi:hypothetical protein
MKSLMLVTALSLMTTAALAHSHEKKKDAKKAPEAHSKELKDEAPADHENDAAHHDEKPKTDDAAPAKKK